MSLWTDSENDLEGYARAVTLRKVTLLSTSGLSPLLSASTNGWQIPTEALIKISEYFDVSIDYLLKGVVPGGNVENNINGMMSNSPFIQANNGGVVFNGDGSISPEAMELLHIYEKLGGRDRLKLLNFAVDLEGGQAK